MSGRAKPSRRREGTQTTRPRPPHALPDRLVAVLLLAYAAVLVAVVIVRHTTPLYGVETDLLGDALPTAEAIGTGGDLRQRFEFKGPGYPLLLRAALPFAGGDGWLAARWLNVIAALAGACGVFALFRGPLGGWGALAVLLGLVTNPIHWQASLEAGTDLPAFALSVWSTHLVLHGGTRSLLAAGFLAAAAVLTRYNAAFLLVVAGLVLVARPGRARSLAAYAAGAALPLAGWALAQWAITGAPFGHRNYLNLAYTFYGQEQTWEDFWSRNAGHFASLGDVLRHDPGAVLRSLRDGVLGHWRLDLERLVSMPVGLAGLAGLLLAWPGRPHWRAVWLHFAGAYLSLAVIFYAPRFFLYLLPFYLAGAAALFVGWERAPLWKERLRVHDRLRPLLRMAGGAVLVGLFAQLGLESARHLNRLLDEAPYEVRLAGRRIAADPGKGGVMARKPHAAHFGGRPYVPLPAVHRLSDLLAQADRQGAEFLFVSGIEARYRPHLRPLADTLWTLPGLTGVERHALDSEHYYALYRFTGESPPAERADSAHLAAFERYAARRPRDAETQSLLSDLLVEAGRAHEAVARLDPTVAGAGSEFPVLVSRAYAHFTAGSFAAAEADCRQALALRPENAWANGFLGQVLLRLERPSEAEKPLRTAVRADPAQSSYRFLYGVALVRLKRFSEAVIELERVARLDPEFPGAVATAARAAAWAGEPQRALALLRAHEESLQADEVLQALRDSLERVTQ